METVTRDLITKPHLKTQAIFPYVVKYVWPILNEYHQLPRPGIENKTANTLRTVPVFPASCSWSTEWTTKTSHKFLWLFRFVRCLLYFRYNDARLLNCFQTHRILKSPYSTTDIFQVTSLQFCAKAKQKCSFHFPWICQTHRCDSPVVWQRNLNFNISDTKTSHWTQSWVTSIHLQFDNLPSQDLS